MWEEVTCLIITKWQHIHIVARLSKNSMPYSGKCSCSTVTAYVGITLQGSIFLPIMHLLLCGLSVLISFLL